MSNIDANLLNPLLMSGEGESTLPNFTLIKAQHFLEAIEQRVHDCEQVIDELEQLSDCSWPTVVEPLEEVEDSLSQTWSTISHLNAVSNTDDIREAYQRCLPVLTAYSTQVGQNKKLFLAWKAVRDDGQFPALSRAQQITVENKLRDFSLAGVDLPPNEQKRFAEIKQRLAELTSVFSNNVLDATQAYRKQVKDKADLSGLPEAAMKAAKQLAANEEVEGFVLTLDMPCYLPVMQYCANRHLREELYRAFASRASDVAQSNDWDNSANMEEILSLRQELAQLLKFNNYAEYSVVSKMASSTDEVMAFLEELAQKSVGQAKLEYKELVAFAAEELGLEDLQVWDIPFASEAMRLKEFEVSQEMLRAYFPADTVIQGMFAIVKRLYDVDVATAEAPSLWHSDVTFYQLFRNGELIAQCYLDLFAREGKRGGAWMADCRVRRKLSGGNNIQLPVAYLTCNFTPPAADQPSLLNHNEVTTLFHEFGHGLHHMLTRMDIADVSGINGVAWDAVELPSQFFENWCWQEEALPMFSRHFETDEPLPSQLLDKMLLARNFQAAIQMVRQLEFATFDFSIHRDYGSSGWDSIQSVLDSVRHNLSPYDTPSFNRFQNSFSHIFSGGYAAGYYSYKWAEVLSADAFSLFEEKGIFDSKTGEKFYTEILSRGGSERPATLFKRFRGREPDIGALLQHNGIA